MLLRTPCPLSRFNDFGVPLVSLHAFTINMYKLIKPIHMLLGNTYVRRVINKKGTQPNPAPAPPWRCGYPATASSPPPRLRRPRSVALSRLSSNGCLPRVLAPRVLVAAGITFLTAAAATGGARADASWLV